MIEMKSIEVLFEELSLWGCDIDEAMDRLMEDKEIFMKFLYPFIEDEKFKELETALQQNDNVTAFECAHALKGVAGNLSLIPIYISISNVVEALRENNLNEVQSLLVDVFDKKSELCKIIKKESLV